MRSFSKAIALAALLSVSPVVAEVDPGVERQALESFTEDIDLTVTAPTLEAHRGGNGGNSIGSQFALIAKNSAKAWEALCNEDPTSMCQYLDEFKSLLDRKSPKFVTVLSNETVYADDGQEREAVNFFDNQNRATIVVSERVWSELDLFHDVVERKINLVLHEYFSIMGIESSDFYDYSRELFTFFIHMNYDISKIASNEALPRACSINFKSEDGMSQALKVGIKSHVSQLNYSVVDSPKSARFLMKASLSCNTNLFISHSCSVYIEVVDTFKGDVVHYDEHTTGTKLIQKKTLTNQLYQNALRNLEPCR